MSTASNIATWFLMFIIYSFAGWCIEVIVSIYMNKNRKPSNRGFLIGPLCPIYGFGVLLMTLLLRNTRNILEVFIVATISSALLEYFTSYIMEKMFRVRWWDYTHEKYNLNGRICLKMLLAFGIMGVIVTQVTNPILLGFINGINEVGRIAIAATVFSLMLTDIIITVWLIVGCRATAGTIQADATDEITANIREILMGQGKLRRRLANAFPSMEVKQQQPRKKRATNASKTRTSKS